MELTGALPLLFAAITLGVIEGVKPGPLMAVIISETMIHDWKAGLKVALVPLITDGPVIILSVILYELLTVNSTSQAMIGILGSFILIWLGVDCFKKSNIKFENKNHNIGMHSLKKGIITNITNPNMYMYWILIGAPFLIDAYLTNITFPFLFVGGFFLAFILLKLIIAILVDNSKEFLNTTGYKRLLQGSGIALFLFSSMFFYDALIILEVI